MFAIAARLMSLREEELVVCCVAEMIALLMDDLYALCYSLSEFEEVELSFRKGHCFMSNWL